MVFKYWANYRLNYVDTSIPGKVLEAIEKIKSDIAENTKQISKWEEDSRKHPDDKNIYKNLIHQTMQENEGLNRSLIALESTLKQPGSED